MWCAMLLSFIIGLKILVNAQTGTCCYNTQCPLISLTPYAAFNASSGSNEEYWVRINVNSCCPSGGDVFTKYNGGDTLYMDTLCRCYENGFIDQTCPYSASDASLCDNVGSDDTCPDLDGLGTIDTNTGTTACAVWSHDHFNYVPQRCPVRKACLNGLWSFEGTYFTNSTLYYLGYPVYMNEVNSNQSIQYYPADEVWQIREIIGISNGYQLIDINAKLGVVYGVQNKWNIFEAEAWSNWDVAYLDWQTCDPTYNNCPQFTEGECTPSPTTLNPTDSPTTQEPSPLPTLTPQLIESTASTASDSGSSTEQKVTDDTSLGVKTTTIDVVLFFCGCLFFILT